MSSDRVRSVVLAGGGTAGHVSPLLALADCLRRRDPEITVTALGTESVLEARLVPERGYPLMTVPKVPLPRNADKLLELENGSLSLVITKQILTENLSSAKSPN